MSSLRLDSLRLVWIEVLLAVAEYENISKAARVLGMSQPTASRHIQALERWLGDQVIVRGAVVDIEDAGANAGITEIGLQVCEWADKHLPELLSLRTEAAKHQELIEDMTFMVGKVRADLAKKKPSIAALTLAPNLGVQEQTIELLKEASKLELKKRPELDDVRQFHRALRHTFTIYETQKEREARQQKNPRKRKRDVGG